MEVQHYEIDVSQIVPSHDCCLGSDKEASWQDLELIQKLPVKCRGMHSAAPATWEDCKFQVSLGNIMRPLSLIFFKGEQKRRQGLWL